MPRCPPPPTSLRGPGAKGTESRDPVPLAGRSDGGLRRRRPPRDPGRWPAGDTRSHAALPGSARRTPRIGSRLRRRPRRRRGRRGRGRGRVSAPHIGRRASPPRRRAGFPPHLPPRTSPQPRARSPPTRRSCRRSGARGAFTGAVTSGKPCHSRCWVEMRARWPRAGSTTRDAPTRRLSLSGDGWGADAGREEAAPAGRALCCAAAPRRVCRVRCRFGRRPVRRCHGRQPAAVPPITGAAARPSPRELQRRSSCCWMRWACCRWSTIVGRSDSIRSSSRPSRAAGSRAWSMVCSSQRCMLIWLVM